jgi:general secretion pathway protein M
MAMIRETFSQLAPREQRLVLVAAWLVGLALVWWVLIAPALAVLKAAPARHAKLDADLLQMQRMRTQAQGIQAQAPLLADEVRRQLEASVKQSLGTTASVVFAGDRATVSLRGVSAEALPAWLAQARANARCLPLEMRLTRSAAAANVSAASTAPAIWDGSVILELPSR